MPDDRRGPGTSARRLTRQRAQELQADPRRERQHNDAQAEILTAVEDAQLEGGVQSKKQAMKFVRQKFPVKTAAS